MSQSTAFLPQSNTYTVAASTAAASITFSAVEKLADSVRIVNTTNGIAWVAFGVGAATAVVPALTNGATTGSVPVPAAGDAHATAFLRIPPGADTVSVILSAAATSGPVYITRGDGGV